MVSILTLISLVPPVLIHLGASARHRTLRDRRRWLQVVAGVARELRNGDQGRGGGHRLLWGRPGPLPSRSPYRGDRGGSTQPAERRRSGKFDPLDAVESPCACRSAQRARRPRLRVLGSAVRARTVTPCGRPALHRPSATGEASLHGRPGRSHQSLQATAQLVRSGDHHVAHLGEGFDRGLASQRLATTSTRMASTAPSLDFEMLGRDHPVPLPGHVTVVLHVTDQDPGTKVWRLLG